MQAGFLFELAVKATLVIGATWALVRIMSRASAAARSSAWTWGLMFILVLPPCIALLPSWSTDVLPISPMRRAVGAIVSDLGIDEPPAGRELAQLPSSAGPARATPPLLFEAAAAGTWLVVSMVWLLGTVLALARLARGLLIGRQISKAAGPLLDPEWTAMVAEGCAQVGVRRAPPIKVSTRIAVPAMTGVLNPILLLPADCDQWSASCRRVVVLHELAHLRRRDCLVQLLADCACAMYWFHPLVHGAASRLRHEREQACDDVVLAAGTTPTSYADHLLDLVRAGIAIPPVPMVAFGTPSRLNQRIGAILDDDRCRSAPSGRTVAAAALAGFAAMTTLAGARVIAQAPPAGHDPSHGGGIISRVITVDTRQRVSDALAAALRDGNEDVRSVATAAIEAIRASGDAALRVEAPCGGNCVNWVGIPLIPALEERLRSGFEGPVDQLASDDVEVRRAAVGRVWSRTQRGAAALTRALLDDDRIVRNGAAIRLDSVHAPIAIPNWIVLLGDTDPMLRERAAISLGVIGDSRAIDPLGEALRDPETAVRLQAAKALASVALGHMAVRSMMSGGGFAQDRVVFRQEDGVILPEVVREVRPVYTPAALQARIQGGVVMRAVVEHDGSVKDVEVVESLDAEHGLDHQATAALKQWEFKPGLWLGEPVPVLITVDMRFTLK
jgi:TonB family protein